MSLYTAIVLSKTPVQIDLPGVNVLNQVQTFDDAARYHMARCRAVNSVETPWCFFLDSDDELPTDYLDVLSECAQADTPIVYTDWLENGVRRVSGVYNRQLHPYKPLMLHCLVLMRTGAAKSAVAQLPYGDYITEHMLYFVMAEKGATWVNRVGYRYHPGQMHKKMWAARAQQNGVEWCKQRALKS